MLRDWLNTLLNRPRLPEAATSDAADFGVASSESSKDEAFAPILSQEDIIEEEMQERANSRRNGVISRFFDDNRSERVKSRR